MPKAWTKSTNEMEAKSSQNKTLKIFHKPFKLEDEL